MTIAIKPTASGSTIEQDGSTVVSIESDRSVDIDSGTLHVDATNNRVGIGTTAPSNSLHIYGSSSALRVERTGSDSAALITKTTLGHYGIGTGIGTASNCFNVYDYNASAERMRIDSSGRVTMPYQPAFVATNNAGTHTTNTSQTFDFNVQKFDKGNNYDPSTYRFTAPVAGTYYFNFHIFEQNGAGVKSIAYKVNGSNFGFQDTAISYQGSVDIGQATIDGPIMIDLAANDYVEVAVRNVASANIAWYGGHSWFMGFLIG